MAALEISKMQQFEVGTSSTVASTLARADCVKGGESDMTFSQWFEFAKASYRKEQGQTMAEYGVVLAVITLGIVFTLGLLSGAINKALGSVIGYL